jgi:hypothetical protein
MSIFLFSLLLFVSVYAVVTVEDHINWMKNYKRIAEDQKDESKRERIYR